MRFRFTPAASVVFATLIMLTLPGCFGSKRPPRDVTASATTTPPVDVEKFAQMYRDAYPASRVGVVIATRPQDRLVAIGQTQSEDYAENQPVTFIDTRQKVLDTGVVVRVLSNQVHIRYDRPRAGGREPREGDLAVKF